MKKMISIALIAVVLLLSGVIIYFSLKENEAVNPVPSLQNNSDLMKISSPAFGHNEPLPAKYTCDGKGVTPPLTIAGVPKDAKSLVLIFYDPDAPSGNFVHWTVWNINPGLTEIAENSKPGVEGITSYGKPGYGLPCPPSGTHRYTFKLQALDTLLNLSPRVDAKQLEKAMEGHILGQAELIGLYSRS
jgi:Raf kinase inhibitor-like YbhB/YbcL family protein